MMRFVLIVIAAYGALVILLWAFQGRLLYLPHVGGTEIVATPARLGLDYERVALQAADGITLDGWYVPATRSRATLLFFHGNAGNLSHRLDSIRLFHELDLSVLIIDYRGYGRSDGRPSETGTALDARAAWRWLLEREGQSAETVVLFGRSLGAAVAAELAREVAPAAVILESPFRSVPKIAQKTYPFLPARWLARFDYATEDYVREIGAPLLVIHSEEDEIIPFTEGRAVYAAANEPKRLLAIHGGHNTGFLESRQTYLAGIDGFLEEAGLASGRVSAPPAQPR
ncbi:alpha/beta hydrolase [Arhodomonas sp. SL1]|uniref:alpha/beta hydrolase n=1 Tax=Arhodomonas sp. SL1 TaxID=3425691 RepID=UPI003F8834CA